MVLICNFLLKNTKINGITLFPFILLKNSADRENPVLLNHEKIHLRQQMEMLIVFFYILYLGEYYFYLIKLKNPYLAYRSISFEREAYANESDMNYLNKKKLWSFKDYLRS